MHLDDEAFRRVFSGSPIKRLGRDRFIRNVLIAVGNSASPIFVEELESFITDRSPLVRAMAVWALTCLSAASHLTALRDRYMTLEDDPEVRAEWGR